MKTRDKIIKYIFTSSSELIGSIKNLHGDDIDQFRTIMSFLRRLEDILEKYIDYEDGKITKEEIIEFIGDEITAVKIIRKEYEKDLSNIEKVRFIQDHLTCMGTIEVFLFSRFKERVD